MRIKIAGIVLILLMVSLFPIITIQQPTPTETAKFVLASWDYPDEYGQGISSVYVHENSTGSWVAVYDPAFLISTNSSELEIPHTGSTAIRLQPSARINHTLHDLSDYDEAKAIMRLNVTVWHLGEVIFSKQNLTLEGGEGVATATTWWIAYEVVINVLLVEGQTYVAMLTYEIYDEFGYTILTATDGNTNAETPTGSYTDTHTANDVFFGGTSAVGGRHVILWIEISAYIVGGFNYSAYWNASGESDIYIYDNGTSDWTLLNDSPNGNGGPLAWDNGTVTNTDYWNSTSIGFKFYTESNDPNHIYVDCFQIHAFQWNEVSEVVFYFSTQWHMWGFDTALIILGLVMIPASALFLVWGGKKKMSSDKLFFALIAFIMGWALLIGGILP